MKYKSVRGMEDILPGDIEAWQDVERIARADLESYGYREIRTPILEDTSIFVRSIGEATDIVKKEMYTFSDRKGRSLTMRPEGTAPIVRAYIEHGIEQVSPEIKLYYIGPMFRSERPQKGRSRQFHQIGLEIIGASSPYADSEVIIQLSGMLEKLGLRDFTIKLNTLGCSDDKKKFSEELRKYLTGKKDRLCEDCRERVDKNVLRVLDCKKEICRELVSQAPDVTGKLCAGCKGHYEKVKEIVKSVGVRFTETKNLVRGLDYYTGTVFEVTHPALGGQDALAAGGRYDNLVKDLGGQRMGAVGYAIGMERLILAIGKVSVKKEIIYIATLGDQAKLEGINLARKIRAGHDVPVLTDINESSLKSQMRNADKNNARCVIIIGDDELKKKAVVIRDMQTKEQKEIPVDGLHEGLKNYIKER